MQKGIQKEGKEANKQKGKCGWPKLMTKKEERKIQNLFNLKPLPDQDVISGSTGCSKNQHPSSSHAFQFS